MRITKCKQMLLVISVYWVNKSFILLLRATKTQCRIIIHLILKLCNEQKSQQAIYSGETNCPCQPPIPAKETDRDGRAERVVFVIEIDGKKDATAMETVKNLFVTKTRDYVTEVDEQSIVLIKDTRDMKEDEELQTLASMIVDNMHTEAMVKVRVGYGNRVHNLQDIAKSYQEAKMALEVGRIFYAERETIAYSLLGIGRLIYQLPMSLCEMFIHEVFGDEVPDIFNEEINTTIQKFFENNLNISETARQLYVHRNTLVYRLERLEKAIGLDIRKFDDAMTFKIAMMVIAHMNQQKVEE